jgi:hypothetical protein
LSTYATVSAGMRIPICLQDFDKVSIGCWDRLWDGGKIDIIDPWRTNIAKMDVQQGSMLDGVLDDELPPPV